MKRALYAVPAVPAAAAAFVVVQVLRAAHRTDLPSFSNQDPSGLFGDPASPRLRIVALGDSSITSPGVEDLDNTWIRRLARSQADRHHVELIALAVGGSKARDVVEGQLDEAVRLRPDVDHRDRDPPPGDRRGDPAVRGGGSGSHPAPAADPAPLPVAPVGTLRRGVPRAGGAVGTGGEGVDEGTGEHRLRR
jgi:hypothetical protein